MITLCSNLQVTFTVNNGNGPMETSYDTYDDSLICDGRWHTIKGKLHIHNIHLHVACNYTRFKVITASICLT